MPCYHLDLWLVWYLALEQKDKNNVSHCFEVHTAWSCLSNIKEGTTITITTKMIDYSCCMY